MGQHRERILCKFHQFVYGRTVTVETDHKPLLFIMKKQIDDCPARLKRMLFTLQRYEFNLVYRPGKQMFVSDFLSRAPVSCTSNELEETIELEVNQMICSISLTEERLKEFQDALQEDDELRELMATVQNGWPLKKSDLNPMLYVYWPFRHEIYVASDVLFKNDRIIVGTKNVEI
uniref:Reverse transcriptase RNase H-like domain-containing protein n=1 Tax=Cacopsylla melanoneura TaxID=428564 RepID=A0A8D8R4K6_9HEMI